MSYSIFFFGAECGQLARTLATDIQLVAKVLSHISSAASPSEADIEVLESLLSSGIQGNWPVEDSPDTFTAFCWLLDVAAESIEIGSLRGFRHWDHWEDTKLWPHFLMEPPPLAVPTSPEPLPVVGYLPSGRYAELLSSELPEGTISSQDVRAVRTEVLEIMESLQDDGLDLLAVAM